MSRPIWIAAAGLMSCGLASAGDLDGVRSIPFDRQDTSSIRYASPVPGVDMGAEINALYNSLPAPGGEIVVKESASFATPIVFGT